MVLNLLLSHTPEQIENLLGPVVCHLADRPETEKKETPPQPRHSNKKLWPGFYGPPVFFEKKPALSPAGGTLTADGEWTSQLRVDQPLIIAEGFRRDIFPPFRSGGHGRTGGRPLSTNARIRTVRRSRPSSRKSSKKRFLKAQKKLRPFAEQMAASGFLVRPPVLSPGHHLVPVGRRPVLGKRAGLFPALGR